MKTLLVNFSLDAFNGSDDLVVVSYDLFSDICYAVGEKLVEDTDLCSLNKIELVTAFEEDDPQDFKALVSRLKKIEKCLFSNNPVGDCKIDLPDSYISWLRYNKNESYRQLYNLKFSGSSIYTLVLDATQIYGDFVNSLRRRMMGALKYRKDIEEIVFNSTYVCRNSSIVNDIQSRFERVIWTPYEIWKVRNNSGDIVCHEASRSHPQKLVWPAVVDDTMIVEKGYSNVQLIGINETGYLFLGQKDLKKYILDFYGIVLYEFKYACAISTLLGKYLIVKDLSCQSRYFGLIDTEGRVLLPCEYYERDPRELDVPGLFEFGTNCIYYAPEGFNCAYFDDNLLADRDEPRIYSLGKKEYFDLSILLPVLNTEDILFYIWDVQPHEGMYSIRIEPVGLNCNTSLNCVVSSDFEHYCILRGDESFSHVSNGNYVFHIYRKTSRILSRRFENLHIESVVLKDGETIISESDGMTIISNNGVISRILNSNNEDIIKGNFRILPNTLEFKNDIALYWTAKEILYMDKSGVEHVIPFQYKNKIKEVVNFLRGLILVIKSNGEEYLIDYNGREVIPHGRWNKHIVVDDKMFKVHNASMSVLYTLTENGIVTKA